MISLADNIFARTELLLGAEGINVLKKSSVAVFGLGGVGSFAAESLARSGVGRMLLVDHDTVDVTNINRQLHAMTSTVGLPKTLLMERRLLDINPGINVIALQKKYTPATAPEILNQEGINFVVDAIDDVDNKVNLIIQCTGRGIPVISAMGAGNNLDPTSFAVGSIWKTSVCPLARTIRKKLRATGLEQDVPVVYSTSPRQEIIAAVPGQRTPPGSVSYVPPVVGMIMAGYVVDKLLGMGIFSAG